MSWEYIKAEEYCDSVRDGTHDTPKQTENGYKLVTGKHIKNGQIDYSDAYYVSEKDYNKINERSLVEQWDVLMSMIGTVGEVAVVKEHPNYAIKNVALFKCSGSELKGKWLAYYLKSKDAQGHMNGNQKGSSQQFLSLKQLRSLPVPITSEEYMQKVVNILSTYDDLIENNQKQIKLLEEAAQRLYKEWFVDLRFPGHENIKIVDGVPKGWEQVIIGDVIAFNPKESSKKNCLKKTVSMAALSTSSMIVDTQLIEMSETNSGSKFRNNDTLLARITPCLENGKTGFVNFLSEDEIAIGSTEFIVMRSTKLNPFMVYSVARSDFFRKEAIKSMTGADGRQRVQIDKLFNQKFLLPPQKLIEEHFAFAKPIFEQIYTKQKEIIRLKEARDRLLPKLMSGELA